MLFDEGCSDRCGVAGRPPSILTRPSCKALMLWLCPECFYSCSFVGRVSFEVGGVPSCRNGKFAPCSRGCLETLLYWARFCHPACLPCRRFAWHICWGQSRPTEGRLWLNCIYPFASIGLKPSSRMAGGIRNQPIVSRSNPAHNLLHFPRFRTAAAVIWNKCVHSS